MIEGSGTHGFGFEALKPFSLMLWGGGNNSVLSEKGVKFIVS